MTSETCANPVFTGAMPRSMPLVMGRVVSYLCMRSCRCLSIAGPFSELCSGISLPTLHMTIDG